MTIIDDTYARERSHEVAMAVKALMSSVDELILMALHGYVPAADIADLQLSHALLGKLLEALKHPVMVAN